MAAGNVCPWAVWAVHENAGALEALPFEKVMVNRFLVTGAPAIYVYICRFFVFLASAGSGSYVSIVFWLFLYAELNIDMCMCVCNSRF